MDGSIRHNCQFEGDTFWDAQPVKADECCGAHSSGCEFVTKTSLKHDSSYPPRYKFHWGGNEFSSRARVLADAGILKGGRMTPYQPSRHISHMYMINCAGKDVFGVCVL